MQVLGLSGGYGHDPAAALVRDGEIVAAVEEERFIRRKHAFGQLPVHAVAYCLAEGGIALDELDAIALAWQPGHPPPWPTHLLEDVLAHPFFRGARRPPVEVVSHPLAHAVVAFRASGFEEAAILIVDGQGDGISTTLAHGTADGVELLEEWGIEDSLGFFFWGLTTHLGWEWGEEGKVMGLAPYGRNGHGPDAFALLDDGYRAVVRGEPGEGHWRRGRATLAAWRAFIAEHHGPPASVRYPVNRLTQRPRRELMLAERERAVAAWGQAQLERVLAHLASLVIARTGCAKLVLGGGTAYNCAANGRLRADPGIEDVYVFPASGDAGTTAGAALHVAGAAPVGEAPLEVAAFGPGFSDDVIARTLDAGRVAARRVDDPAAEAARRLAAGQVIAWFQGRMEIGPRALGQRSILAAPTSTAVRDRVNALKGREPWRPLAPSLLADAAAAFLSDPRPAPFMLTATAVREERRADIPAVVHVDGSCRPQTVRRGAGTPYARLLEQLEALTGLPVVLNTSFNIGDEPIVLSPADALRSFASSGLDAMVIGDSVVTKDG